MGAIKTRKSGFTLIEIIIVIVILGILAAIALPKLTSTIDKSRAAEAFTVGDNVAHAFDRCVADASGGSAITAANVASCNTFANLGMTQDPSTTSSMFSYSLSVNGTSLRMLSTCRTGGCAVTDVIDFTFDGAQGHVTRGCGGAGTKFANYCK